MQNIAHKNTKHEIDKRTNNNLLDICVVVVFFGLCPTQDFFYFFLRGGGIFLLNLFCIFQHLLSLLHHNSSGQRNVLKIHQYISTEYCRLVPIQVI